MNEVYKDDKILFDERRQPRITPQLLIGMVAEVARFRADTVLLEKLEPLQPLGTKRRRTRDRFITKTKSKWLPMSKEETIAGTKGLYADINAVARWAPEAKKANSISSRYEAGVRFWHAAAASVYTLNQAITADEGSGPSPNLSIIRGNSHVLHQLAAYFIARSSLDEYKWQEGQTEQTDEELEMWLDYLSNTSDSVLLTIFNNIVAAQRERLDFWTAQIQKANSHKAVKKLMSDPSRFLRTIRPRLSLPDDTGQPTGVTV